MSTQPIMNFGPSDDDPEVKKVILLTIAVTQSWPTLVNRLAYFSYVTFSRKRYTNAFLSNRQKLTADKQLLNSFSKRFNCLVNAFNR